MSYSTDENVKERISFVSLPTELSIPNYRTDAESIINLKLRNTYIVPVSGSLTDMTFLRNIESDLSGGNILLRVATVNGSDQISALGQLLVDEAMKKLDMLIAGSLTLEAPLDTDDTDDNAANPRMGIGSPDLVSTFGESDNGASCSDVPRELRPRSCDPRVDPICT